MAEDESGGLKPGEAMLDEEVRRLFNPVAPTSKQERKLRFGEMRQSRGKTFAKNLKSPKRASLEDTEWNSLMDNGKSSGPRPKKRRRKHYVVLNSLPLSQDLRNDRFEFKQPEVRG